jgi:putative effector of murein hydrolase
MLNLDPAAYGELLTSPLFVITLSVAAHQAGNWVYRRTGGLALLHPTVLGALLVALLLWLLGIEYADYKLGVGALTLLLGTATVALAVPLYLQLPLMRSLALPLSITLLAGASFAALSAVGIAWALGGNELTLLSLAPKSVSTPIAIGISREIGGLAELTTGAVIMTAAIGISVAPLCYRLLHIDDARVQGFALGIAAHAMGAARAFETNAVAGAFASLGLCLTGTLSAVAIPLLAAWLR